MATIKFVGEAALSALIAKCKTLAWEVKPVNELPATGEERVLYLVPVTDGKSQNVFDEYIWVADSNSFEKFGSGTLELDLDNYAKKADFDGLKEYVESLSDAIDNIEDGEVTAVEFDTTNAPEITIETSKTATTVTAKVTTDLSAYAKTADLDTFEEMTADEVEALWNE